MYKHVKTPVKVFCLHLIILGLIGCDGSEKMAATPGSPPWVIVEQITPRSLLVTTDLPGRTVPSRVAVIRPQVSGIVLSRDFIEGSDISAGQSLYHIDPAPFRAQVAIAQAQLSHALAQEKLAHTNVTRYRPLADSQVVSRQDFDQVNAASAQASADVASARAALTSAQIDLAHSAIIAPISGRIDLSSVTEGALVQANQPSDMATVQQLDPIYVDITQPGQDFLRLQRAIASGELVQKDGYLPVTVLLQDNSVYPIKGSLGFSDITVDQSTGVITLRAIIPNPERELLPGMFVRARLDEGVNIRALLVPQQAVTLLPAGRGDGTDC